MKSFTSRKRRVAQILLLACLSISSAQLAQAQSVSVSPADLSFGIPTGTPSPLTSTDVVTVNLNGTGPVTLNNFGIAGTNAGDFIINGNTCVNPKTAPATCQIGVTFTSTLAAGVLETATLSFNASAHEGPISVPLNGAFGAIKLFGPLNVNSSLFPGVTWPNSPGQPDQTIAVNLSCPASGITGTLSSSPDGVNNVFQDNTITIVDKPSGVEATPITTTNVCYGGDPNFQGFLGFPAGTSNCFQAAYEGAANGFVGQNPDLAAGLLTTYGVQPLNLMNAVFPVTSTTPLYPPVLQLGSQSLSVQMLDAGGLLGSATLHLVTNCTLAGVTPGGSVTGNPINPNNSQTLTQTATFDSAPGQNISLTTSSAANPTIIPAGTIQRTTDIAIPQQLFSQLVANTSAAPSVCLRLSGEKDSFGNPMCKGFLAQCSVSGGAFTGDNCVPTPATVRNLYDQAQFASPDALPFGTNFLGSACNFFLATVAGVCAPTDLTKPTLIGPGMLLGSDNWTCAPGQTSPSCTPQVADTHTLTSPVTYSSGNCVLTGGIAGNVCPLDTLTQFLGAADPSHGGTTTGKNSIFIPVVNMPKPFTQTTIAGQNPNGWVNTSTISATFISNQATYLGTLPNNPDANGFKQAPPYSVSYGLAPASAPLPDTTYPVASDTTQYAGSSTKHPSTDPIQSPPSIPNCTAVSPNPSFTSTDSFTPVEGIYNLHYFTTDCAFSEGLLFNPTPAQLTDPTANWASFQVTPVGVDAHAPTFAGTGVPAIGTLIFNQAFTLNYECDDLPASSGIQTSGMHTCDSSLSNNVAATSPAGSPVKFGPSTFLGATPNLSNKLGTNQSITITAQDYAGNTTPSAQTYNVWYAGANISCGPTAGTSPSRTFLAPVGADASATVKKGRSVPFKFRVCDANGVSIGASGPVIASIGVQMIGAADGDTPEDIADAVEDTNFHWDAANQFWIYNLRTRDKERNFKYVYTLTLNDGTTLLFSIKVK